MAPHSQIKPASDEKYLGKNCICTENVQLFFVIFPKQNNMTASSMAFTLYWGSQAMQT
jgi:hypothetical protein